MAKPKSHRRWTTDERRLLRQLRADDRSIPEIAKRLHRSEPSVREQLAGCRRSRGKCRVCGERWDGPTRFCSPECATIHRNTNGHQQPIGCVKPRPPKRFKPTLTFGVCPKCGQVRTCVHVCRLSAEQRAVIKRELFPFNLKHGRVA